MHIHWLGQSAFAGSNVPTVSDVQEKNQALVARSTFDSVSYQPLSSAHFPSAISAGTEDTLSCPSITAALNFYGADDRQLHFRPPSRPLRAIFLTSIRDVGKIERVGQDVYLPGGPFYMQGTLETALRQIAPGGALHDYLEIAAVVTDDHPKDLKDCAYPHLPRSGQPWIHPLDLTNQSGQSPEQFTYNIPSLFRQAPRADSRQREALKLQFESRVHNLFEQLGADLILVDHYMARIEFLVDPAHFSLYGKVLNTHPGLTRSDATHPCLGKDCEIRAIEHAQGRRFDERSGSYMEIEPYCRTGASFHVVNKEIDAGPVLCDAENTPVRAEDSSIELIHRNYLLSKNPVFVWGVKHYAAHLFPGVRFPV